METLERLSPTVIDRTTLLSLIDQVYSSNLGPLEARHGVVATYYNGRVVVETTVDREFRDSVLVPLYQDEPTVIYVNPIEVAS